MIIEIDVDQDKFPNICANIRGLIGVTNVRPVEAEVVIEEEEIKSVARQLDDFINSIKQNEWDYVKCKVLEKLLRIHWEKLIPVKNVDIVKDKLTKTINEVERMVIKVKK